MAQHALDERRELAATLRAVGPAAPTLCAGWSTSELAAHLVLRERSFVELAGRLPVQRFREHAEKALTEYQAGHPYPEVVDEFERGPSWPSPGVIYAIPPVREAVNLVEYLVHHEDVRRAAPSWQPRLLPLARQRAIWSRLRLAAHATLRAVPVGVELNWPAHGTVVTRRAKHGYPVVAVTGDPVELTLLAFGRDRVAQLDYDGTPAAIAELREARISV